MGIANTYCIDGDPDNNIVAVSGQYFRNLDEGRIRRLFSCNFVIMDGEAAHTLFDMGHGGLAGIMDAVWHPMESGFQAYEQACGGYYAGVDEARVSAQTCVGDFLEIAWVGGAKLISEARRASGKVAGVGMVAYDSRVLVLPNGRFGSIQGYLAPIRQSMLQAVLADMDCQFERPAYVVAEPNILLCQYTLDGRNAMMLTNCSNDETGAIKIVIRCTAYHGIMELDRYNTIPTPSEARPEGTTVVLEKGLGPLSTKVLLIEV
jgi:hypothetical protein